MEYACEKSLNGYLLSYSKFLSINSKLYFLLQVLMGLRYCRDHRVVHLDIKPENKLVRTSRFLENPHINQVILNLIDFGESFSKLTVDIFDDK